MDTLHEENSPSASLSRSPQGDYKEMQHLQVPLITPQIVLPNNENLPVSRRNSEYDHSGPSSRRPSAIIAALRRPSQAMALSAAQAVMHERRYLLGLFNGQSEGSIKKGTDTKEDEMRRKNRRHGDDSLTVILSALYAKLLVVLGMAFPITEIISREVEPSFYQGFYLYLYLGSIVFVTYMYASLIREKAVVEIINSYNKEKSDFIGKQHNSAVKYGSFYLRLGAIAFGIGSMVYSGLEFGRYFELKNDPDCISNILEAITPATRMLLTLVQVQFIFLNSKDVQFNRHKIIARFGLMHMIATNLCEWLYVLVEETKHEIIHLEKLHNNTNSMIGKKYCQEGQVMGSLVISASPFLFPCTIEYSLICAVILFEMWKRVKDLSLETRSEKDKDNKHGARNIVQKDERVTSHLHFNPFGGGVVNSNHHFTVDCSNAHRGLFAGIMVIVLTIISLIMFFVLTNTSNNSIENHSMAELEVSMVELVLYVITTVGVIVAMMQLRKLKYDRKIDKEGNAGIGLDNTLLVVAQTGMFIYSMFSLIGFYFTLGSQSPIGLAAEIFSFVQTCLQTMFVLDGWFRRCRSIEQTKNKPGRELITFLIVANMAMWTINTLEKNRAEFRPTHLKFFGDWAWTIITHISMPLAIFYRNEGLRHSLIILNVDPNSDVARRKAKNTKWRRGDQEMMHTVSAFYAKILVILGIALPVTDAIATFQHDTFDGFYMYLYIGSISFLLYMNMVQLREKPMQDSWSYTGNSNELNGYEGQPLRRNSFIRYGSFYFRMGVTGFGIGSLIYSALQFGEYWELSSEGDCNNLLKAIKPMLRIVFVLMQMLFIFSFTNVLGVQRTKVISNFGMMHMIGTNLCEWFLVLVQDTQRDIYRSAQKRQQIAIRDNQTLSTVDYQFMNSNGFLITKNMFEHKLNCMKSNIMPPILARVHSFLSPCTVEYSLLCAVILALMWKDNCANDGEKEATQDLSAEISGQSGCNVIYSRSHSQFSVDCAQAHKGLFSGILVLAVTIISLIMFFELVTYKEFKDATVLQSNIWEAVLFWTATIAAVFCMASLRDISLSLKRGLELEHLLLLVTQCGLFMYFLFQIIGGVLMGTNKGKGGLMRIITPFSALVQSCCQTVLILDAWRRRCCTEDQIRRKPGRQLITFLLVINIALWIVNRLKNNRSVSHPNQMDFYGVLSWNIITHVSMPLVVSYRFQSTVCFYEIWKHVYKMRPIKRECDHRDDQ